MTRARHVYFMRPVGMQGPVKIGCSHVTEARRLVLSKWSPFKLEIIAKLPGQFDLERRLHNKFRRQHSHCEWFEWSPELQAVIEAINDGTFDVDTLPEARGLRDPGNIMSGPVWSFRGTLSQRLSRVRANGVAVPLTVKQAHDRLRGRVRGVAPNSPADAQIIQRFLEHHGYEPRRVPANDDASLEAAA